MDNRENTTAMDKANLDNTEGFPKMNMTNVVGMFDDASAEQTHVWPAYRKSLKIMKILQS